MWQILSCVAPLNKIRGPAFDDGPDVYSHKRFFFLNNDQCANIIYLFFYFFFLTKKNTYIVIVDVIIITEGSHSGYSHQITPVMGPALNPRWDPQLIPLILGLVCLPHVRFAILNLWSYLTNFSANLGVLIRNYIYWIGTRIEQRHFFCLAEQILFMTDNVIFIRKV